MPGRREQRVTINEEFDSFDDFIDQYVANISRTGVFIKTRAPLPVGTEVDLRVTVVADGIETLEGIGTVVRVDTDPAGMGIEFKELTDPSQSLVDRLLTAQQ